MGKKVELLSPAGNYEAFIGAVNAGADAVYLGGQKFGARAFADNFTAEEICRALHVAHFYGKKIYLTVNTLIKESEFSQLYEYLAPFYEAGLDGIIIQDLGVLRFVQRQFPELLLHASTQINLTGVLGAFLLKEYGVKRVVPARELSLDEIRHIKQETGLEIECFIHGAMCYCYSGQCLFSSILGGRSGNRGRCAQPCRLPYRIYEGDTPLMGNGYPLSLKDMCTIQDIPKLIEAGIDSFKIEGRMKKPEYTAGVTALYRKYIDYYYTNGKDSFYVEEKDIDCLKKLYIRSEIQSGYYDRHNGKDMVSLRNPGYLGSDEALLSQIREKYIHEPAREKIHIKASLTVGMPFRILITGGGSAAKFATAAGEIVSEAKNAPLGVEEIKKQLSKTGNSLLAVEEAEVETNGNCFLPLRALNSLRREAVDAFEKAVILEHGLTFYREHRPVQKDMRTAQNSTAPKKKPDTAENPVLHKDCLVSTAEQLRAAVRYGFRRIYIDSDLYLREYRTVVPIMEEAAGSEWFLALPYVLRARDKEYLERLADILSQKSNRIGGFLLRNLEGLGYVSGLPDRYKMIPDVGLYSFNEEAVSFWKQYTEEFYLPYELNSGECRRLAGRAKELDMQAAMVVYGTIPMMITANCLALTAGRCRRQSGGKAEEQKFFLKDRYQASFPVLVNCAHCYNIIYNSVPLSLHMKGRECSQIGASVWRYDFITETAEEMEAVLSDRQFPFREYTAGHFKRGVE